MDKKCVFCDRIWGVFGVALGGLIMLIGFDLLSGGALARVIGTPAPVKDSDSEELVYDAEIDE